MAQQICRDDWTIDESSLITMCVLGHGSYGSVTLMKDSHNRFYAKKKSPIYHLDSLQKELNIMLRLQDRPCIVQAKSPNMYFENNMQGEIFCYIYMEYAKKRTLRKLISDFRRTSSLPMPEYLIQRAARMILQGLDALHTLGYVHCDIKPSNVLVFESTTFEEPWDLKLADFGLSKDSNTYSSSHIFFDTELYMPPEFFVPDTPIVGAIDIWSLGCIIFEMFGGKPTRELTEEYYDWNLSEVISPVAKDFLKQCHAAPLLRPKAAELLNHAFITQRLSVVPSTTTTQQDDHNWPVIQRLPDSFW